MARNKDIIRRGVKEVMLEDENYRIIKIHICNFERNNGILSFNTKKYPERLCVHDKKNNFVIDVETGHKYPYVRVLNMQYFYYIDDVKSLTENTRVACMEYVTTICDLTKEQLRECKNTIKLLQMGKLFIDGNQVLSNEQYLEMINNKEKTNKTKKIVRKRK